MLSKGLPPNRRLRPSNVLLKVFILGSILFLFGCASVPLRVEPRRLGLRAASSGDKYIFSSGLIREGDNEVTHFVMGRKVHVVGALRELLEELDWHYAEILYKREGSVYLRYVRVVRR